MALGAALPLAGRAAELAVLERAVADAGAGRGGLVVLQGDAGAGKSRLAEAAIERAEAAGFATAWGSAWPEGGAPPLWPWHAVLEQLTGDIGVLDVALEPGDELATSGPERFGLFRAVTRAVEARCAVSPVLAVLDDVHAADPGALLLTRFVARTLRRSRLLLLATVRSGSAAADSAELVELLGEGQVLRIGRLDAEALAELLVAAGRDASRRATAELAELTGGNALLVREALAAPPPTPAAVTAPVRALLAARLAAFDGVEQDVLAAAAVLGPLGTDAAVAAVAGHPVDAVAATRRRGRAVGLLVDDRSPAGSAFAHGLLRDALLDGVADAERVRLHAAAADALAAEAGEAAEVLGAIAHHRLAAAGTGDVHALDAAVESARLAASVQRRGGAAEAAAGLLQAAAELRARAGRAVEPELWLQLAQAELAAGRLRPARVAFRRAVAGQAPETDPAIVAEAAIGLGGIWVHEHRSAEDVDVFHRLVERALLGLGESRPDLRARLGVRLATEAVYLGTGTPEEARAAVDAARATGDPLALAEALSLYHHVTLGPRYAADRPAVAEELVQVATAAGDAVLALMGVLWRTVDLFLAGDYRAERSLQELRQRADALRVHAILYIVELMEGMLLLRAGRLAEAEEAAGRAFATGTEVGDADAPIFWGAQILALRWLQGDSIGILDLVRGAAATPPVVHHDRSFLAVHAAVAADIDGQEDEARRVLATVLAPPGLDALPQSSSWLVSVCCLADAAARLGDAATGRAVHETLLPYAGWPAIGSLAVTCRGPVDRYLAIAAAAAGRLDDALAHHEAAVEVAQRLGNLPYLHVARVELGLALRDTGRAEVAARAEELVSGGVAALRAMGAGGRAAALLRAPRPVPAGAASGAAATGLADATGGPRCRLALVQGGWEVQALGERAVVPDAVGLHHLARLLAAPGQEIAADELAGVGVTGAVQERIDAAALDAYRKRIVELQAVIGDAEDRGDARRLERAQDELDGILEHVGADLGLGGRARAFTDERERARTAVRKAIRRALQRIGEAAPRTAVALEAAVRTGTRCVYVPSEELGPWHVDTSAALPGRDTGGG